MFIWVQIYVLSKTSLGKKSIRTNGKEHEQEIGSDYQNRVNHVQDRQFFVEVGAYAPICFDFSDSLLGDMEINAVFGEA